jgi:hypothetical protein
VLIDSHCLRKRGVFAYVVLTGPTCQCTSQDSSSVCFAENILRPCLLLRVYWGWEGKFLAMTRSRKFPNDTFTFKIFLGNFPAHPLTSRPAKLHRRVSSTTRVPRRFCSWKRVRGTRPVAPGADDGGKGDGGGERRGKSAPTKSSFGDWSPVSPRISSLFPSLLGLPGQATGSSGA